MIETSYWVGNLNSSASDKTLKQRIFVFEFLRKKGLRNEMDWKERIEDWDDLIIWAITEMKNLGNFIEEWRSEPILTTASEWAIEKCWIHPLECAQALQSGFGGLWTAPLICALPRRNFSTTPSSGLPGRLASLARTRKLPIYRLAGRPDQLPGQPEPADQTCFSHGQSWENK